MSVAFASLSGFLGGLSGAVTQQGMLDSALPHGRSRAPSRAASRAPQTPHRLRSFAGVEAASVRPSRAPSYAPAAQSALPSRAPSGLPLSELSIPPRRNDYLIAGFEAKRTFFAADPELRTEIPAVHPSSPAASPDAGADSE